jgi:hypothetical protein
MSAGIVVAGYLYFCASAQTQTSPDNLLDKARRVRLSDDEVNTLAKAGPRMFERALDGLRGSASFTAVERGLATGFNIGRSIDADVYASNVVRIGEAKPSEALDVLVARMDPKVKSTFRYDSPDFKKLGSFAIKPLMGMDMVQRMNARGMDERAQAWVYGVFDRERLDSKMATEMGSARAAKIVPFLLLIGEALVVKAFLCRGGGALAAYNVNELFVQDKEGKLAPIKLDLISPAVRQKLKLTALDVDFGGKAKR